LTPLQVREILPWSSTCTNI